MRMVGLLLVRSTDLLRAHAPQFVVMPLRAIAAHALGM